MKQNDDDNFLSPKARGIESFEPGELLSFEEVCIELGIDPKDIYDPEEIIDGGLT